MQIIFSEEKKNKEKDNIVADIYSIKVSGSEFAYSFSVEVKSPDKGCTQYADWWEVLTENGTLVYRRVLLHSHVDEQPFVRSGGPVIIKEGTVVIIRAHMHPDGYGGTAMKGTVKSGFKKVNLASDFAINVEKQSPQPDGCAF